MRRNIYITTSGWFSTSALKYCIENGCHYDKDYILAELEELEEERLELEELDSIDKKIDSEDIIKNNVDNNKIIKYKPVIECIKNILNEYRYLLKVVISNLPL